MKLERLATRQEHTVPALRTWRAAKHQSLDINILDLEQSQHNVVFAARALKGPTATSNIQLQS